MGNPIDQKIILTILMDNNYLKYIKYKRKYLELKKIKNSKYIHNHGGAASQEIILKLYTTGLGNNLNAYEGNESNQNILQYYVNYRGNIFSQLIEAGFTIEINHYDPLTILEKDLSQERVDLQEMNINYIKKICKDESRIHGVMSSNFHNDEFNEYIVDVSEPHLILDFAHVFTYTKNPDIQQIGLYYEKDDVQPRNVINLNILRVGFLGNIIAQAIFRVKPLFLIDSNGSMLTLNKIIQKKLPNLWPQNVLESFFNQIITENFAKDGDLELVESVKATTVRILEEKGIKFLIASELVNSNFNIDMITRICNILVRRILNNEIPQKLILDKDGRSFLRDFIRKISEEILELIFID